MGRAGRPSFTVVHMAYWRGRWDYPDPERLRALILEFNMGIELRDGETPEQFYRRAKEAQAKREQAPEKPDTPHPVHTWAINGLGGAINLVDSFHRGKDVFSEPALDQLRRERDRLSQLIKEQEAHSR